MSIQIQGLSKSYQNKKVLNDISLCVSTGSIFGLLGVNGAGKTTLLSILNFLCKKESGSVKILDKDIDTEAKQIKMISNYVPQTLTFYPNLTGYENLTFFAHAYGLKGKELEDKVTEVITLVSLEQEIYTRAKKYSGGYQRRLNLAIGLLNSPVILYLDEPTVGVDAHTRGKILNTIKKINQTEKTTVIYTSHYMEEIEYICDDIAILDKGKIILHEKKEALLKYNSSLQQMFIQITKEEFIL